MKKIIYFGNEVKIGDIVNYNNMSFEVTEKIVVLNPLLFQVVQESTYFKCVNSRMSFTLGRVYEQKDHSEYPERVSLKADNDVVYNIKDWTSNFIFKNNNCFELTTKEEWCTQKLLDEAKKRYPVGTVFRSLFGEILTVKNKPCYSLGAYSSILIDNTYVYRDGRWAEVFPLKFTTEDGVDIYEGVKTWMVHPNDSDNTPFSHGAWNGNSGYKYFYHKGNALAYIEKYKEKTLEEYENMLLRTNIDSINAREVCWFYNTLKGKEPKLYYTKILQLIADDLNDGWVADFSDHENKWFIKDGDSKWTLRNNYGSVPFKTMELSEKARSILGDKVKYLFN